MRKIISLHLLNMVLFKVPTYAMLSLDNLTLNEDQQQKQIGNPIDQSVITNSSETNRVLIELCALPDDKIRFDHPVQIQYFALRNPNFYVPNTLPSNLKTDNPRTLIRFFAKIEVPTMPENPTESDMRNIIFCAQWWKTKKDLEIQSSDHQLLEWATFCKTCSECLNRYYSSTK